MTATGRCAFTPRQRRAFGLLVASEIKIAIRRPVGLLVAVGIPLALLVIFGSIPATTRPDQALGGISFFNLYVPTLMVFVLIAVGSGGDFPSNWRPTASRASCAGCRPLRFPRPGCSPPRRPSA